MNVADEAPSVAIPAPAKSTSGRRLMPRTGPDGVGAFLRAHGFPISDFYLNNICAPLVDEGPKPVMLWNCRPLYEAATVLDWAEGKAKRTLEEAKARAERSRAARDAKRA